MQLVKKVPLFLILTALLLCTASMAFAASVLSISSSGNGVFILEGRGWQDVGGAVITIRYDAATLANPRVAQGSLLSGATMMPNTTSPGVIILGLLNHKGISGSGPLATITFDLPGSSPGVIQSLAVDQVIDINLAKLPSPQPQINNPPAGSGTTETTATAPGITPPPPPPAGGGTTPTLTGGTTIIPAEGETAMEKGAAEAAAPPPASPAAEVKEPAQPSGETAAAPPGKMAEKKFISHPGVLDQFRTFKGVKTPPALIALFEGNAMPGIRQEPPVLVSDGAATAKVFIQPTSPGKETPNFALKEAKLVSLKMTGENSWVIEVLPVKGTYLATIRMHQESAVTEIPLTVAPPLPKGAGIGKEGKLSEADFILFLKEHGTEKAPRFDLNGDGRRDYIDDYIFTANYLVTSGKEKTR